MQLLSPEIELVGGNPPVNDTCALLKCLTAYETGRSMPEAGIVWLRDLFLAKVQAIAPIAPVDERKLIYTTRKGIASTEGGKVRQRFIDNEDEFLPGLVAMGFEVLQLEDYTIEQKIRLFASARMVISPQSASLVWSLFLNSSSEVIELFPDRGRDNEEAHYCYLARLGGCFWTRYEKLSNSNRGNDPNHWNFIVTDPSDFLAHVQNALNHPEDRVHVTHCKKTPVDFPDD